MERYNVLSWVSNRYGSEDTHIILLILEIKYKLSPNTLLSEEEFEAWEPTIEKHGFTN